MLQKWQEKALLMFMECRVLGSGSTTSQECPVHSLIKSDIEIQRDLVLYKSRNIVSYINKT